MYDLNYLINKSLLSVIFFDYLPAETKTVFSVITFDWFSTKSSKHFAHSTSIQKLLDEIVTSFPILHTIHFPY